jgi:hypothetical protein
VGFIIAYSRLKSICPKLAFRMIICQNAATMRSLLEEAVLADALEKEGFKIRLGRVLTEEEQRLKKAVKIQSDRGEAIGTAARGVLRPTITLPRKK